MPTAAINIISNIPKIKYGVIILALCWKNSKIPLKNCQLLIFELDIQIRADFNKIELNLPKFV